jgi:hypothetical protein
VGSFYYFDKASVLIITANWVDHCIAVFLVVSLKAQTFLVNGSVCKCSVNGKVNYWSEQSSILNRNLCIVTFTTM